MFDSVFVQIGIILGLATLGGLLGQLLRQPLIVVFIAVGILLGPSGFGMVELSSEIELFARLGIALLLFVVGLKLDLHIIRTVGPVALMSGLGQVVFTSALGYLIGRMLGMEPVTAVYVAVALTFSSTIIVVKLLSDKREVDTLHGRIALGLLIVQDIVVVLVMIALTAFGEADGLGVVGRESVEILIKGVGLLLAVAGLTRYVLPGLLHRLAHSSEMLTLFAMAWAILGAALGDALGFSKEVGAFLAGVSIASTPYREQIGARLVSLRDFLLLFFFIELGAALDLSTLGAQFNAAILFSLFVLIGNPLIVMAIMGYMGYRKRTGFLTGLTVAQISEFSLILAALGLSLGHLPQEAVGLITLVGLITISASTYMILYSHPLYERLSPYLGIFERRVAFREDLDAVSDAARFDVILIGLGRYGAALAANLKAKGCRLLAVDFDPEVAERRGQADYIVRYGDAEDTELLATLPLAQAQWVVNTVRNAALDRVLTRSLRQLGYGGKVAISASNRAAASRTDEPGVDLVLVPYADAAKEASDRLMEQLQLAEGATPAAASNAPVLPDTAPETARQDCGSSDPAKPGAERPATGRD